MRNNINFLLRNKADSEQFAQFSLRIYQLVQERCFPFSNQRRYCVKTEIILTSHYNITWSSFENFYQNSRNRKLKRFFRRAINISGCILWAFECLSFDSFSLFPSRICPRPPDAWSVGRSGPGAWAVKRPTLHGGPVRLRSVRATPRFIIDLP